MYVIVWFVYFSFNENNLLYHISGVGSSSEADILENTGVKIVNSNRKTSTTPEGMRRRSELEKILAKNAYYKKLNDGEVASKEFPIPEAKTKSDEHLKPSQIFLEDANVSENTDVEINECGKLGCYLLLMWYL